MNPDSKGALPMKLGDVLGPELREELARREAAKKRRAELEAMGFKVPPLKEDS